MIPICVPIPTVQKGIFSLAGLLHGFALNLIKPAIKVAPAGLSLPVREDEAGLPTVITSLNEARLTVIRVSNEAQSGVIARGKGIKKGSISSATLLHATDGYQPFGSMPKRSNSLRPSVLSQFPRLIPSADAADSNCAFSSGVILIWNVGDFPETDCLMSRLTVDMYVPTKLGLTQSGTYPNTLPPENETPPNGITSTERGLTTTVITSNEEAVLNHITPQQVRHSHTLSAGTELPSFIWIIAAVRRDCQSIAVKIHHIDAKSEHEARQTLAREHVTFFAGRIRKAVSHAE